MKLRIIEIAKFKFFFVEHLINSTLFHTTYGDTTRAMMVLKRCAYDGVDGRIDVVGQHHNAQCAYGKPPQAHALPIFYIYRETEE